MVNNILKIIRYKNYDIRYECYSPVDSSPVDKNTDPKIVIKSAYTKKGKYIGDRKMANFLFSKGIEPELRTPTSRICSIGFSKKQNKYYGWSHRAICGFKLGDKIFDPLFGNDDTPFTEHGILTIRNLKNAKQSAKNFAEWVS